MKENSLELSSGCRLNYARSDHDGMLLWCDLTYTEHQADPWYGDSKTDVQINEDAARKIIAFLQEAYPSLRLEKGADDGH